MRIALLCHKFWPSVGGLCTYTGRLSEYLVERGHDVRVFTTRLPPSAPPREDVGPTMHIRRFTPRLANHPPYYFMPGLLGAALAGALRSVDIVHTVGYYFFPSVLGHAVAAAGRRPVVSTPVYTLNPTTWQRNGFDAVLGRGLVRHADHVIVQSEHERDLLLAHRFTLPPHSCIPFGVDTDVFELDYDVTDLRQRLAVRPGDKVLLSVGKIMSPKGSFDCLEAVARLRASGLPLRLVLIGEVHEAEQRRFLARIHELSLDDAVTLTGPLVDRTEIARYYQLSDAVLFPSQYEQFGMVAIEAGASARPLLGTPVGIMRSLVPETEYGLLHHFGDIDQFAANLREVLTTPRYRENAARHRAMFLREYAWRRIAERTETVYTALTGDRRAD